MTSCRGNADRNGLRTGFIVLQSLSQNAKSECFRLYHRRLARDAVRQNSRQLRHLGDPTAVLFAFALNREVQAGGAARLDLLNRLHGARVLRTLPTVDISSDRDDNYLLAMAKAGEADFLVTGDAKHLLTLQKVERTRIVAPTAFLRLLRG